MMKTVAIVALAAIALAGCQTDRHMPLPPVTAKIPQSLKQACAKVVSIPDRDLTRREAVKLWSQDRRSLLICARRHGALAKAASVLEAK